MGRNIEIKARVRNLDAQRRLMERVSDKPCTQLMQVDTFFVVPHGRLKLRQFDPEHGELICYQRTDQADAKLSDYQIVPTAEPERLCAALATALGVHGVVRKTRHLYFQGQTRIHLDDVQELGWFIELEVVLQPDQTETKGEALATELMRKLDIQAEDLIDCAYIDLLLTCISPTAEGAKSAESHLEGGYSRIRRCSTSTECFCFRRDQHRISSYSPLPLRSPRPLR